MTRLSHAMVTGARGFIGRRLVQTLLDQGTQVVCLDRPPARTDELSRLEVRRVTGDVRDAAVVREAIGTAEAVFHLAATTAPRSEALARATNVEGTRNLAEVAARRATPPTLVYVSSLAVAGPSAVPVTEIMECRPVSIYGRTKLAAEHALQEFAGTLPVTIVRPPCVFGPGDRNLLAMFRSVRRGWNFYCDPRFRYSFLHVADLAAGLVAAAERGSRLLPSDEDTHTGVYYMADPESVTFPELAARIAECLGRARVRQIRVPGYVGWAAATVGECFQRVAHRRLFFNRDKAREAYGGSWVCDASRARVQLDCQPALGLARRLAETADSYRKAGWLPST